MKRDELPSLNDLRDWAGHWLDEHRAEAAQARRYAALLRSPEAPNAPLGTAEESEADAESADAEAAMYAAILALLAPQKAREPDGWITIYDDLSREVVLDRVRADAQAAQGYRVRPFVYLGAPAEATEAWLPTAENINALPEPIRRYIHDLSTRCDPAGEVRELTIARDTIRSLEAAPTEAAGKRREWVTQAMVRYAAGHATLGEAIAEVLNAVGLPAEATERSEP